VDAKPFEAPGLRYLALEAGYVVERVVLAAGHPYLQRPAADPHPVLVLPSFLSGDGYTRPLRNVLRQQGYRVHGWKLGRHKIWTREFVAAVERRLEELNDQYSQPVSVVGTSLGGMLARELAREHPDQVRQVISVVSPFRHRNGDDNRIVRIVARLRPEGEDHYQSMPREEDRPAITVPVTAIYSRTDAFVDWRSCREEPGFERCNIEIRASHVGAGASLATAIAVSERLACPPGGWYPFTAPRGTRALFPSAG
jgi:predicted alpha/beta hydrolase family esterase